MRTVYTISFCAEVTAGLGQPIRRASAKQGCSTGSENIGRQRRGKGKGGGAEQILGWGCCHQAEGHLEKTRTG